MNAATAWLSTGTAGMPRWGWVLVVMLVVVETALGRARDERFRSVGDSLRNLLVIMLSLVPVGGPLLVRLLQALYVLPRPVPAVPPDNPAPPPSS